MRFSFLEFKKFHGRPVSIFAESKISRSVRIPQQDSAVRAFNKLARTFAAQVETLDTGPAVAGSSRLDLAARPRASGMAITGTVPEPRRPLGEISRRR